MYQKPFFIDKKVWNNAFSYNKRKNKKIYVPNLISWEISDIKLWKKIVFEDFDFDDKLSSCSWLENFYEITWKNKKIFLFDNHNHAFYFWYLARNRWIIKDNNTLYHIDEHSDMRDPENYILKPESYNLEEVFNYTNFKINVWNYIIPAKKEWILKNIIQIRNEENLNNYLLNDKKNKEKWIILNLDLDFFQADLDFIDYKLKKKVVLDIAEKAKIITVATSPFFIKQNLAIKVFKDIFWHWE